MSDAARRRLAGAAAWVAASVLPSLVAMRGSIATDRVFCFRDMAQVFWPLTVWFKQSIAAGEYPLWDPYVAFGQSAIADPTRALLFPPVVFARVLLPAALALNLSVGLAFPVAALGMYLLLRPTLSRQAAALGAVAFSVSGPMLSTGNMLNFAWAAALAPWVLWALLRVADRASTARIGVAALAVAMQLVAGEIVTIAATLATAILLALALERGDWQVLGVRALRVAGATLAGALLAAVQYAPLAEAVVGSDRGSRPANLSFWSVHPLRLVELVASTPFGDPTSSAFTQPWLAAIGSGREPFLLSLYLGVSVVVLAAVGAAAGPRRRAVVWGVVAVVALLCALGAHTPFYPVLAAVVPPLRLFRYPEKYAVIVALAVSVLAAGGLDVFVRDARRALVPSVAASVVVASVVFAVALASPIVASAVGLPWSAAAGLRASLATTGVVAIVVGAAVVATAFAARRDRLRDAAVVALVFVVALDLVVAGFSLNPQASVGLITEPKWASTARARDVRFYVGGRAGCLSSDGTMDPDMIVPRQSFPPSVPETSVPAIAAAHAAQFPGAWRVRESVSVDGQQLFTREYKNALRRFCAESPEGRARFLDRTGVRVELLNRIPGDAFELHEPVDGLAPVQAFSTIKPFARCAVVSASAVEPDANEAANRALFDSSFDPSLVALVDRDVAAAGDTGTVSAPRAAVLADASNEVTVEADAPSESTLVLFDSFAPGWHVEVDDRPADLLRADGLFRGVRLAPGHHRVRFVFRPGSFEAGAVVSAVTAIVLAVLWLASRVRSRRRDAVAGAEGRSNVA